MIYIQMYWDVCELGEGDFCMSNFLILHRDIPTRVFALSFVLGRLACVCETGLSQFPMDNALNLSIHLQSFLSRELKLTNF